MPERTVTADDLQAIIEGLGMPALVQEQQQRPAGSGWDSLLGVQLSCCFCSAWGRRWLEQR